MEKIKEVVKSYRNATSMSLKDIAENEAYRFIVDYDTTIMYRAFIAGVVLPFSITNVDFPTNKKGVENVMMRLLPPFFDKEGSLLDLRTTYSRIDRAECYPACIREVLGFCKIFHPTGPLVVLGSPHEDNDKWSFPVIFPKAGLLQLHLSLGYIFKTHGNFYIPVVKK